MTHRNGHPLPSRVPRQLALGDFLPSENGSDTPRALDPDALEYALKVIRFKARESLGKAMINESDIEDIQQEILIDLLARFPQFDPSRAKLETFITRVVRHKLMSILRARTAPMRDCRRCMASLHDPVPGNNGDGPIERWQALRPQDDRRRNAAAGLDNGERSELAIDVAHALNSLTPTQRTYCRQRMLLSVAEIAAQHGVSRNTVYRALRKARGHFEDLGLDDYVSSTRAEPRPPAGSQARGGRR